MRLAAGAAAAVVAGPAAFARETVERNDLASVFAAHDTRGTFALLDARSDRLTLVDATRANTRMVPASTFKIANSLIALETGVVKDENEVIPYGGKPQPFKAWEKDMPMREAIAASNVPIYQELARRIGLARYAEWLARLDYGNRRTGTAIDTFWLNGPLEISAVEQAAFAARLARNELSASDRSQAIVRDITRLEARDGRTLHGKTGWRFSGTPQLGWWTGWVDTGSGIASFSLNLDMASIEDAKKRIAAGRDLLARLEIF